MMTLTRQQVHDEVLRTLREIRDDWDSDREITDQTGFFRQLGFESIDVVALGSALEEQFDQQLPFAEFLTAARERQAEDVTVGELVTFLVAHLTSMEQTQS